jgi:tetratricopeptide (TPR) repeat protein
LKKEKILIDARAALGIEAGLKELIFATTAEDDTSATDAAVAVENILREEGYNLVVAVYGWGQLQTLISVHEVAYNAFQPSAVATSASQSPSAPASGIDLANLVAAQVVEQMRSAGLATPPRENSAAGSADEDPSLHARIDIFRDLFRDQAQPLLAERGLLGLLEKEDLKHKPWARYRIETNLGAIAIDLGREIEAAARFEAAHAARPNDTNALANLALARTIQKRFEEAMVAAQAAIDGVPRADHAVGYLLQAAARSEWVGDPESLIPSDLVGTPQADIGLAEFLRRRNLSGWAERSLDMARQHRDTPEFKRIGAIAVLTLAIEADSISATGHSSVTSEELERAADDMKARAERCLDIGFADRHDLIAYLNNAAILLRLCDRHAECEMLLLRDPAMVRDEPQLRRLLALAQSILGRKTDALATLIGDSDPENRIFRAELQASSGNVNDALNDILTIDYETLSDRLRRIRWRLLGEMSLQVNDLDQLDAAVAGLRAENPHDVGANLLEIRGNQARGEDEEVVRTRLRALAISSPDDLDIVSRYMLGEELQNHDLPMEASQLLEGHIDLSRLSPPTSLYLQSLAAARRDDAFRSALTQAASVVRDNPTTLWTVAAHGWNLGDLKTSLTAVDALLAQLPEDPRARLLKVEILVRQDRSRELLAELDKHLENLNWNRPRDLFRIASLLGHFGYVERAAALAYRLFLEHRDISRAWMTLSALVIDEGRGEDHRPRLWSETVVSPNAAIDLRYDDGSQVFFVIEPDARLRKLDSDSWEPDHPLVRSIAGLEAGARFTSPDGREGVIGQIRHKYVARLHYVIEHHEARFPEVMGFRRIAVDFENPGGLDGLIAQVKARHDWIQEEVQQYLNGPWPLGVLAHRIGMDTIDAAGGIGLHGSQLKVALGSGAEREAADRAVRDNMGKGCVLDLLSFWTAWQLKAMGAVLATCGPIHVPQSVLDRLRARREQLDDSTQEGLRSAGYSSGRVVFQETPADVIVEFRDNVNNAINWIEENVNVQPIIITDNLPSAFRDHIRLAQSDLFDSMVLAIQNRILLITDDFPTRQICSRINGAADSWLHVVFGVALARRHIDADTYLRWSANLIDAGQGYLGVSGPMLAHAAHLDGDSGNIPGYLLRTLSKEIGGKIADPRSHILVCLICFRDLWASDAAIGYRKPVTSYLLQQLLRGRVDDYDIILKTLLEYVRENSSLSYHINEWIRGHFLAVPRTGKIQDQHFSI